jgi:hypothetical protein
MKKLICLFAFIGFGLVAANAQNITLKNTGAATSVTNNEDKPAGKDPKAVEKKKTEKKKKKGDCSTADKKECGTKAGGKSCCSHKEEN